MARTGKTKSLSDNSYGITERERIEAALRESQTRFQALVETTGDFIWEMDAHGVYTYCSPQVQTLWGLDPKEMIGKSPFDLMPPEDREQAIRSFSALAASNMAFRTMEVRSFDAVGNLRFLEISGTPFCNAAGKLQGYRGISRDITERKQADESLQRAMRQIQTLNRDLERRADELEVANEELERLAASLAVDLRAPLVSLRSVSRVLAQDYSAQLPPQAQSLFQLIQANADEMEALTQGLLQLMRVVRQTLHPQELNPEGIIRAAWAELEPERAACDVEFTIDSLPDCHADPHLLKQIWGNLLSNALKATRRKEHARIQVGGYSRGKRNFYFVQDNGIGFDMSYAGTIFRPFQRYHHADEWPIGSGVGLAIVESIIRRHGGRLWAEGAINQGATFYFEV